MFALITGFMEAGETPQEGITREVAEETGLQVNALSLIGVYDFQRMNQVIVAYHALATRRGRLSPELAEYKLFAPEDVRAGAPAPVMRWPTGCARAATNRSSSICRPRLTTRMQPQDPSMEVTQGTRHPRPELPAAHPEGQEGPGGHAERRGAAVVSTDPGSVRDFQAFARQTGNELVEQTTSAQRVRARAAAR
jgi:ADP-ribose pyrophosphatase YjhB (NUDIX family)